MHQETIYNKKGKIVGYLQDDGDKFILLNTTKDLVMRVPKEGHSILTSIMIILNHDGVYPDFDDEGRPTNIPCPKGEVHQWFDNGVSVFCKKCHTSLPKSQE